MDALETLIRRAQPISYEEEVCEFAAQLYWLAEHTFGGVGRKGNALAALFDLAVTATYLQKVPTKGWYYCPKPTHAVLTYPFVNICPSCLKDKELKHLSSNKPSSASIGKATSQILTVFLDRQAKAALGDEYAMMSITGNEMVDAILLGPEKVVLFEIKSAPLIAFPIIVRSDFLTVMDAEIGEATPAMPHSSADVSGVYPAELMVDEYLSVPVGRVAGFTRNEHFTHILNWLSAGGNVFRYVESWERTFAGYADAHQRSSTYWLTNGCGVPNPRPRDWPRRQNGGHKSISDGKSSVGLDRTDDMKKGIYQVLKISTHYKEFAESGGREVYVALVSNIHAVKHHDDYLAELEDLVWTIDGSRRSYVRRTSDGYMIVPADKVYNLFDGLISFTHSHFRAEFLKEAYDF